MGSLLQNLQSRARHRGNRVLVLSALLFSVTATATVTDRAAVFSPQTRKKVSAQTQNLQRFYKAGIQVDTFASAPGLKVETDGAQNASPEFNDWLRTRAEKGGTDNVYVLIVKTPPYLLVSIGQRLRERDVFPRVERDMLIRLLATRFQNGDFDKGLLEGSALIRDTLSNRIDGTEIPTYSLLLSQQAAAAQQMKTASSEAPGSYLHWIGLILVLVFGTWLAYNIFQTLATKHKEKLPLQDGT